MKRRFACEVEVRYRSSSYVASENALAFFSTGTFPCRPSGGSYAAMSTSLKVLLFGKINLDKILHGVQAFPEIGRGVLADSPVMALGSSCADCRPVAGTLFIHITGQRQKETA